MRMGMDGRRIYLLLLLLTIDRLLQFFRRSASISSPVRLERDHFIPIFNMHNFGGEDTYDHRSVRTGHPVRSAIHKH
jgi:hypothetical protein